MVDTHRRPLEERIGPLDLPCYPELADFETEGGKLRCSRSSPTYVDPSDLPGYQELSDAETIRHTQAGPLGSGPDSDLTAELYEAAQAGEAVTKRMLKEVETLR